MLMLLVYSASNGPRLQYIVNFFSNELFDQPIKITTSEREYLKFDGPKLNYSLKVNLKKLKVNRI